MKAETKNGAPQKRLPYAFSRRDEFLLLSSERRLPHLWEAYTFCEKELGGRRFSDDELQRNLRVLRRMMLAVAKETAKKLEEDGSWQNKLDPRWPRNHKGDDVSHWYDTGAYPPQFLTLPEDPSMWRIALAENPEVLFDEMIAWVETPAGQAGVGDEALQKLLQDRSSYVPGNESTTSKPAEEFDWNARAAEREEGLQWLADKSADGSLKIWSSELKLEAIQIFLGGISSNRRPIDQLLPELMNLEANGDWEALQQALDVDSPADGVCLAKLRACLPSRR